MKLKTYNCTYTTFIFSTLPVFITPEIKTQLFALKMLGKYTLKYTTCTLQTPPPPSQCDTITFTYGRDHLI